MNQKTTALKTNINLFGCIHVRQVFKRAIFLNELVKS